MGDCMFLHLRHETLGATASEGFDDICFVHFYFNPTTLSSHYRYKKREWMVFWDQKLYLPPKYFLLDFVGTRRYQNFLGLSVEGRR